MINSQAMKFIDKSVYVVDKGVVSAEGILKRVEKKTGAGTVLTKQGKNLRVPVEKLYPNK